MEGEAFVKALEAYRAEVASAPSHHHRLHLLLGFLREALGVDPGPVSLERPVLRGRVDALLGDLVVEVKTDLAREGEEARAQLQRYLASLRRERPGANLTGLATDGLRFQVFRPHYEGDRLEALHPVGELDLGRAEPEQARLWLAGLLAHTREGRLPATPQQMVAGFGPASPTFRTALLALSRLHRRLGENPSLQTRFHTWGHYLARAYGSPVGDVPLFLRHTYLALLARLIAYFVLEPGALLASPEELEGVATGEFFTEKGLTNFVEEDFFTWPLLPGVRAEGLALLSGLHRSLGRFDLASASTDLLKGLYEHLVDPEARHDLGEYYTPDWLAEWVLRRELALHQDPTRSLLDPACGSGTFLFTAVRLLREGLESVGIGGEPALEAILEQVVGVDIHPLAVAIARTNYLLALGDLLKVARGEVHIPVYLGDALHHPDYSEARPLAGGGEPFYTLPIREEKGAFEFPAPIVEDPRALARVVDLIRSRYLYAALRAEDEAGFQRALDSFYQYLVSPVTRRKPFTLTREGAERMVGTLRTLVNLVRQGKDNVWPYILSNAFMPVALARRRFDLVVGNPPWLSLRYIRRDPYYNFIKRLALEDYGLLEGSQAHLITQTEMSAVFFARCADLYLKEGGTIAFVMPRSVMVGQQHARFTSFSFAGGRLRLGLQRLLDLEGVSPLFRVPACVLVARKGEDTTFPVEALALRGQLPARNAPLGSALARLQAVPLSLSRLQGRLLPHGTAVPTGGPSPYYGGFYQGATIVPRPLWFVRVEEGPLGFPVHRPPFRTAEEALHKAKPPWDRFPLRGNVESCFLYATLTSGDILPFGYLRLRPVLLPLLQEGGRYTLLDIEGARQRDYEYLARWLEQAQRAWEAGSARGPSGQPKVPRVVRWLDYRRKLTRQRPGGWKVLYNASGTNLTALALDASSLPPLQVGPVRLNFAGFIADAKSYLFEASGGGEARYLTAVLNAPCLDEAIKPLQSRGLWGERDIHKRPLLLPIPAYDGAEPAHARLAELGAECARRVAGLAPELARRFRAVGRARAEVRRLLAPQLGEIDRLVRGLLGL